MGSKSAPPPSPNYSQLAQQQGTANVDAARATARLSNPNIIGPLGTQKVTYGTVDQAGYDKAMADFKAAGGGGQTQYDDFGNVTSTGPTAPTLAQFTSDVDTPTVTQTLNPMGQQTLEEQQKVSLALAQLGQKGVSTAQNVLGTPFQYKGPDIRTDLGNTGQIAQTPNLFQYGQAQGSIGPQQRATGGPQAGLFGLQQGGVQGPQLQSQVDTGGPVSGGPAMGQYGMAQGGPSGPQLQQSLDTSNLAAMPVNAGMTAQNAIMSRLEPQLQRQRAQRETQLANQGLARGGEAYNAAIQEQQQGENDLRTQAALQGLNLDMSARQQGLGEQQALGSFGNQAALSQFGAGQQGNQAQNAAIAQNYGQAQASAQQGNAAQQQQFNQRVQAGEFGNQAQLASFNANLQNQQAANQAVGQNFQQGQQANQAYNQAVQQNMAMGLTAAQAQNQASQQLYSQLMGSAGFQNQVVQQNQQTALQQQQAQNAAQAQQYNQALQGAQFGNTAAQQALQQQLGLYNQPLNQIAALMSGSQVQMPQFQGYQGSNVAAAPIFESGKAQGLYDMNVYNQQMGANNALMGTVGQLGGSAMMAAAM